MKLLHKSQGVADFALPGVQSAVVRGLHVGGQHHWPFHSWLCIFDVASIRNNKPLTNPFPLYLNFEPFDNFVELQLPLICKNHFLFSPCIKSNGTFLVTLIASCMTLVLVAALILS